MSSAIDDNVGRPGAAVFDKEIVNEGTGHDREVGPTGAILEVGIGGAPTLAVADILVVETDAELLITVQIFREWVARLLPRGEEGLVKRVRDRTALHIDGPSAPR